MVLAACLRNGRYPNACVMMNNTDLYFELEGSGGGGGRGGHHVCPAAPCTRPQRLQLVL